MKKIIKKSALHVKKKAKAIYKSKRNLHIYHVSKRPIVYLCVIIFILMLTRLTVFPLCMRKKVDGLWMYQRAPICSNVNMWQYMEKKHSPDAL